MTSNPFLSIWTRPRETVRAIVSEDHGRHVYLLSCLASIDQTFDRASNHGRPDAPPLWQLVLWVCLIGTISGPILLWISSLLLRWTGPWLGGTASARSLRIAIAWAAVPAVAALALWVPCIGWFGNDLFLGRTPRLGVDRAGTLALLIFHLANLVLGIWHIVLLCNTVAEVQGFRSAWRGLANIFVAGLVCIVPVLILASIFILLYPGS